MQNPAKAWDGEIKFIVTQLTIVKKSFVIYVASPGQLLSFLPGDFATKVKQINSQSDLTSMSSLASPSYLTIRSSVYMILI